MKVQLNDIRPKIQQTGKEPENNAVGFKYCRKLLKQGVNPEEPLEIYRGEELAYTIKSIGEGAKLTIEETAKVGPRFKEYKANPMYQI